MVLGCERYMYNKYIIHIYVELGLPWWFSGLISGSGRSPGEGNGNRLQYSGEIQNGERCLGNPMDRGAWWATVHGVAKSQTRLSN